MATQYEELEERVTALERLAVVQAVKLNELLQSLGGEQGTVSEKPQPARKAREYTDEERAAIRDRLAKGREAKAKARADAEAKAEKAKKVEKKAARKRKPEPKSTPGS